MQLRRLQIENFRGINSLDLRLKNTTVLIGENNTGKTAVLDALRFALREVRTRRGCAFEEYDFHLPTENAEPSTAPPIAIKLTFQEDEPEQWDEQQVARLQRLGILQVGANGHSLIILKVGAYFDVGTQDFIQNWEFQNAAGVALTGFTDAVLGIFHNEISYYMTFGYIKNIRNLNVH